MLRVENCRDGIVQARGSTTGGYGTAWVEYTRATILKADNCGDRYSPARMLGAENSPARMLGKERLARDNTPGGELRGYIELGTRILGTDIQMKGWNTRARILGAENCGEGILARENTRGGELRG